MDVLSQHGTNIASVRGPAKDKLTIAARRDICFALRAEGMSSTQIGEKINRDHTSVLNLLGLLKRNKNRRKG